MISAQYLKLKCFLLILCYDLAEVVDKTHLQEDCEVTLAEGLKIKPLDVLINLAIVGVADRVS